MAHLITGRSGAEVYREVLRRVDQHGRPRTSRDGDVVELSDVTIALDGPDHALPLNCGRGLNLRIAAAEALQLIGAFSDPARLCQLAPQFERFREDIKLGERRVPWFHGAYGVRIGNQLHTVVRRLRESPDTRQAVITLWNPSVDDEDGHLDYPCTVALGFSLSDGFGGPPRLNARVTMRSNDVWLGLPYDIFQFTQLQWTIANILDAVPGTYTHTAWSLHLYDRDHAKIHNVTEPTNADLFAQFNPRGLGRYPDNPVTVSSIARQLWTDSVKDLETITPSERWYLEVIHRPAAGGSPDVASGSPGDGHGDR